MAAGRWLVAVAMLLGLMACSDPEPTTMNPSATVSTDPTDAPTTNTSTPTTPSPELVVQRACIRLYDSSRSPSLMLVDYLLQTQVTAKDNAEARRLLKRLRALGEATPKPLGERIGQLADEIGKIVRTRRAPGFTTPFDGDPIQRLGKKITSLCRAYV